MICEKKKLKDCCISIADGDHQPPPKSENGVPFVTIANVVGNNFDFSNTMFAPETYYNSLDDKRKAQIGDVLYSVVGSFGIPVLIKEAKKFVFQRHIAILRSNTDVLLPEYLYYTMLTRDFYMKADTVALGAAQRTISLTSLRNLEIDVPPLELQERIIDKVLPYDELIENNRRQIKLLEEAAQRLYKEWFVDLRFPGWETTPITDGVPEGWHIVALSEIASVNKQSISKQYPYDYVDYTDIGSVSMGRIKTAIRYATKDAPGRAKRIAFDGDILWGMVRPNLRSYALVFHPAETSAFSTGFAILHAEKVPFSFLYCHVTQDEFVGYLINCTNGAAYPAVKPIHFEKANLLLPTDELLERFHSLVGPMFRKVEILERQIRQATEARDRLLPKLMSGELEMQ